MKHPITSTKAYNEAMVAIQDLMNKGEANLSEVELAALKKMPMAAEEYEENSLGLKPTSKHGQLPN